MSFDDFDYENTLNTIKASLFDIYENQEKIIGNKKDDLERQNQIDKYIKMKDNATSLIKNIESLYPIKKNKKSDKDNNNNKEQNENIKIIEVKDLEEDNMESVDSTSKDDIDEKSTEHDIQVQETEKQQKFYLDNRNGNKPNFAYVPVSLIEIIKENAVRNLEICENEEENNHRLIKNDKENPKGIIVRNDQYMKLALSRHRQESVLQDAKSYRINQAKIAREKLLDQEKENFDNKIKTLKVS